MSTQPATPVSALTLLLAQARIRLAREAQQQVRKTG